MSRIVVVWTPACRGGLAISTPLSFGQLRGILTTGFRGLPDARTGRNKVYAVADAAAGAFSVFFTQSPSFLAYQRDMQRREGRNNARSLFGVERIPTDPHIRNLLDPIAPEHLRQPFWAILALVADAGLLIEYEYEGSLLLSMDGTGYFSSGEIHCQNCTVAMRGETPYYSHTALLPALVRPGKAEVIALEPEFVMPQDGAEKQDCELNAAKRWVTRNAHHFARQRVTILADDLYCKQPFCQLLLANGLDFVMTCKPDSHETLYEEVAGLTVLGAVAEVTERVWTEHGRERRTYRYVNQVPLRADAKTLMVNWCEVTVARETNGDVLYRNAFATNLSLSDQTVAQVVAAGRARWKIENENNNVLKNHGYHLEHNYGHGSQHLASVLVTLLLLAFLCHTVLQLADTAYQRVRAELVTRKTFFDDIRALTRYLYFESWEDLLHFMIAGLQRSPG
jgi:hypothetical protein